LKSTALNRRVYSLHKKGSLFRYKEEGIESITPKKGGSKLQLKTAESYAKHNYFQ